jgi:hypothetical protein
MCSEHVIGCLTFLHIHEVLGSNFDPEAELLFFSSFPPGQCSHNTLK